MATAAPGARRSRAIPTTTSIVEDHGSYASSCGYCDRKGPTSKSLGMHAHVCSVEDYQSLLDRGWRRSGRWMYRPHLDDTCCPPYTIRLDACAFTATKSQRKVEKRWRQYLDGDLDDDGKRVFFDDDQEKDDSRRENLAGESSASGESAANPSGDRAKPQTREMRDADANRRTQKTKKKRVFEIREAPSSFDEEEYRLWRRYQASVHGDDEKSLGKSSYRRFLADTPLRLEKAPVFEPEDDEKQGGWVEWPGYKSSKKKKKKKRGETEKPRTVNAPQNGFGSFHHQYRVDGRLVAVGVVDILPKCLSSKYFFWEPCFAWASLGKLGALREIEWVKNANKTCVSLRYYYLGYYIYECPKMRYKAEYRPSELKCAVTGKWTTLDDPDVLRRLEGGAFAPLRAPEADNDEDRDDDFADAKPRGDENARYEEADVARDVPVGMAAGGQILQVAPFSLVRQGPLGGSAGAALARRIETWRRATGDAGDAIVYLVDLERFAPDVVAGGAGGGASDESVPEPSEPSEPSEASSEGAMGAS